MEYTSMNTGLVRLTYANIWEPRDSFGEEKYSAVLLIPKTDIETIKKIKTCIENAKNFGANKLNGEESPKTTLKDGDRMDTDGEAYPDYYKGHFALNTSSRRRPGIVDKDCKEIFDKEEVYSGCYAVVNINFYAYNANGNVGIACGLNHIMKIKDGKPLAGGATAEQVFAGIDTRLFSGENDFDVASILG